MGGARSDSSSSGEEDGDAEWRAAIDSVANSATSSKANSNGLLSSSNGQATYEEQDGEKHKPQIKLYQIKAQKLLDDMLEKTIELVTNTDNMVAVDPAVNDGGVRLFKRAPPGIVFDHVDELHGPRKKPRILPGEELDEKSKKFRKQLKSAAVDGAAIIETARAVSQKSLAKLEAREAASKEAAKREENRIAELKKVRGEKWLPSIARDMRLNNTRQK